MYKLFMSDHIESNASCYIILITEITNILQEYYPLQNTGTSSNRLNNIHVIYLLKGINYQCIEGESLISKMRFTLSHLWSHPYYFGACS